MPTTISVAELSRALDAREPIFLLDVRQPWENETAALPGSVLVPLGELASRADDLEVPAGARVVTYCHHGVRSFHAALILESKGWDQVASLEGGIDAWSLHVDPRVPRY
jgi:adenylyltransferase/sulfurtransferase